MIVSLIAAKGKNNVIGNGYKIPWHLPKDFAFFKEKTMGHCLIMGRKTYVSLGKALPGRYCIVLSRDKDFIAEDSYVVQSIDKALAKCKSLKAKEVFIAGGSNVYKEMLSRADKMYLTEIDHSFSGDIFFPKFNSEEWERRAVMSHSADAKNPYDFTIFEYTRK